MTALSGRYWADEVTYARKCEATALAVARRLRTATSSVNPYQAELHRARYRAALDEVQAWTQYAKDAEAAFQSAALAEMEAADEVSA